MTTDFEGENFDRERVLRKKERERVLRESVCVSRVLRERERDRERESVSRVLRERVLREREFREREFRERVSRERESVCVCVLCVRERESFEREREF